MKKKNWIIGICMIFITMMAPFISAHQYEATEQEQLLRPFGAFQFVIYPYNDTIRPGIEQVEMRGYHQYIGNPFVQRFPGIWFWQHTTVEVVSKPEWVIVVIPEPAILSPPDGRKQNFSMFVSVTEDAPAYQDGMIHLGITTGPFWRTIIGLRPPYHLDQQFSVQAGYLPVLTPTTPQPVEIPPNSNDTVLMTLKNVGNARSILQFSVDIHENDLAEGWSIVLPFPVFIDPGESLEAPFEIYAPQTEDPIDDWAVFPITIQMLSVVEGDSGPTANYTVPITAHCIGT